MVLTNFLKNENAYIKPFSCQKNNSDSYLYNGRVGWGGDLVRVTLHIISPSSQQIDDEKCQSPYCLQRPQFKSQCFQPLIEHVLVPWHTSFDGE